MSKNLPMSLNVCYREYTIRVNALVLETWWTSRQFISHHWNRN